jgi:ATP/maltotriose-dependent transcriptional regulator MalT
MNGDGSNVAVVDSQPLRADALALALRAHGIDLAADPSRAALAVVHADARDRLLELRGTPYLLLESARPTIGRVARQATATIPATADLAGLLRAVDAVLAGDRVVVFDRATTAESPKDGDRGRLSRLSDRERMVLACLARGLSNQEIGAALDISANTARTHVQNILGKLGVTSRHAAVATARRGGLLLDGETP